MRPRRVVLILLTLVGVDFALVVITGGVSALGLVGPGGIVLRLGVALGLLALDYGLEPSERRAVWSGYLALLLLFVALLHARGYRLRGDGLWYYSFAHSVAFDGDINLSNQYRRLGIEDMRGSQPVPGTGRARYTFPVGAPFAWVPFLGFGHLGAWVRNVHGLPTAYDGFSDPYFHAVALGSLLFGWAGLLVLHRFLRRWFSPWVSFVATGAIASGTFLAWYLAYHAMYTHSLTFLLIALFLNRWVDEPESPKDYAILGLLLGMAACVRWQNAVFSLLPGWSLAGRLLRGDWRFALGSGGVFASALLLGLLPQFVSWKVIFGSFYIGVPLGAGYMRWSDPFLTEILFSSRHGLFSWSPLLLLAALGLLGFVRREPRLGLLLCAMLLLLTYVNSAVADWWAGGSYGARRFDSVLPIFALGLATAVAWLAELVRRHPRWIAASLVAIFVAFNALLMEQYRKGRVPVDDTVSWETAARGMLEDVFDGIGYPFSFPMNWLFAARYDRPKTQYDILVGKYLFHRMHNLGGVIDLGENDPAFLGNGWSSVRDWPNRPREVRLAVGARAGIFVPTVAEETLRIIIECAVPAGEEPRAIEVWLNGFRLGGFLPTSEMAEHTFTADARLWRRINLLELAPVEPVDGKPYLAVDRLRFERLGR